MNELSAAIDTLCKTLSSEGVQAATRLVIKVYPFAPVARFKRKCTDLEAMRVFVRDGFIDRYSGTQLVFPGVLRLMSDLMPEVFPFHPNWKVDKTHPAYWDLFPTIDHIVPIALGGIDNESNWVSTSQIRNSAKGHWTLEDLGWKLCEPGNLHDWDGLTGWFLHYAEGHGESVRSPYLMRWLTIARRTMPQT